VRVRKTALRPPNSAALIEPPAPPRLVLLPAPETVSILQVRRHIKVGERRVRQLVAEGRLQRKGHRITTASLQIEIDRRRKYPAIEPAIENIRAGSLPDISVESISKGNEKVHAEEVMTTQLQASLQGLMMLTIPRAAAGIGLSEGLTRLAVRTGQLDSVVVGRRRRVTIEALQRFARGKKGRK
jgi:hypothetical protein